MIDRNKMTLRHYVLIVESAYLVELMDFARESAFENFSVSKAEGIWYLSHPLTEKERIEYKWLFHKMKAMEEPEDEPEPPRYA
jgi:hypothetical protein